VLEKKNYKKVNLNISGISNISGLNHDVITKNSHDKTAINNNYFHDNKNHEND
jgi:hypothetical protein